MKATGKKAWSRAKKSSGGSAKKKKKFSKQIFQSKILAIATAGALISCALFFSLLAVSLGKKNYAAENAAFVFAEYVESARELAEPLLISGQTEETGNGHALAEDSPKKPSRGKLIFVIDDAGNSLFELEPFLRFSGPLTIAVLPGLPDSAEAAQRIRDAGKEALLHQPMESLGAQDPGPGAIFANMEVDEIRSIVSRNLDEVWPVAGINNHQGSRVSMDEKIMEIVLDICRERGIVFLDSRTTAETAAPIAALRLGMQIGERDVFIDNEHDRDAIVHYINAGLSKAEQNGSAVMIGHATTPGLASLLEELYSSWIDQGYTLSTLSGFINEK